MNESSTVSNLDITSSIPCNVYNDFTGSLGNIFPPVSRYNPLYIDELLNKKLSLLKKKGKYSKDIQNITIDNKFSKKMNNWKKWINYKRIDKELFKYIDIFDKIDESLIKRIDTFLL